MRRVGPAYSEADARAAIAVSRSWSEALRRLDMCHTGTNWRTLKHYAVVWQIPTSHFDPHAASRAALARARLAPRPLDEILVERSSFSRSQLKKRLYAAGLKERRCELCGQGEEWHGRRMGLILDHVNGIRDDNRLENLRIVCPNCAATFDTHCGRNVTQQRACASCGQPFRSRNAATRHCSLSCGQQSEAAAEGRRGLRRVERPSYERLLAEVEADGWCAVGRRYGVSDNAIRKWVQAYERERDRGA